MSKKETLPEYKPGDEYKVTRHGSLGLLAVGHHGVRAWRKAKAQAKAEEQKESKESKEKKSK